MELQLQNAEQHRIADLLWVAQSQREVDAVLRAFGHNAYVVYNMMIAATFDQVDDTNLAEQALDKFRK